MFDSEELLAAISTEPPNELRAHSSKPLDPTLMTIELAFWDSIKDSDDPATFEAYLQKYPEGEFRHLAEIIITKLRSKACIPECPP